MTRTEAQPLTRSDRAWVILLFLILLAGSALLVAHGIQSDQRDRASSHWPSTEGTIVRASVESRPGMRPDRRMYRPLVSYSYAVGETAYDGDRIRFGELESTDERAARRTVERYPPGTPVQVSYDPEDPNESVLEPGSSELTTTLLMGVTLLLLVAACAGVVLWHRAQDARAA